MFDKIIDVIIQGWSRIRPFVIVPAYSEAILLRLGKLEKTLKPGIHFKIPLIDDVMEYFTVIETISLPAQSLFLQKTKTNLVVKGLLKYKIVDGANFFLKAYAVKDALADVTQAGIKNVLISLTDKECYSNDVDALITAKVKQEASEWGIEVIAVTLTDIAPVRSYRLFNEIKTDTTQNHNSY